MVRKMKYWHRISNKEFDEIHKPGKGYTWKWANEHYKAPTWCKIGYCAIDPLGCWSLIDRKLRKTVTKNKCRDCDESKFYKMEPDTNPAQTRHKPGTEQAQVAKRPLTVGRVGLEGRE